MTSEGRPRTLGELKRSGYKVTSVKEEMRRNLIERIRSGKPIFDGIFGYEESVVPQLENAILSGQDIIFLGERGQAFSPHLTIARVRSARNKVDLAKCISTNMEYEFGQIRARCLRLKKSDLTPRGPIYSVLKEVCL